MLGFNPLVWNAKGFRVWVKPLSSETRNPKGFQVWFKSPSETWKGIYSALYSVFWNPKGFRVCFKAETRKGFRFDLKGGLNFSWNQTWIPFGFQVSPHPPTQKGFWIWFKPPPPETLPGHLLRAYSVRFRARNSIMIGFSFWSIFDNHNVRLRRSSPTV